MKFVINVDVEPSCTTCEHVIFDEDLLLTFCGRDGNRICKEACEHYFLPDVVQEAGYLNVITETIRKVTT